jgi:hypothetical protein
LRCVARLPECRVGGTGVDKELAMEVVPAGGFRRRSGVGSGPDRCQRQRDTSCRQDVCTNVRNALRVNELDEREDCSGMSAVMQDAMRMDETYQE